VLAREPPQQRRRFLCLQNRDPFWTQYSDFRVIRRRDREKTYELCSIRDAVRRRRPGVECNRNERGEAKLYQRIGRDGKAPVHCPRHLDS
jgi:hypothetical protein